MEWRLNNIVSMQKLASRHQGTNKPIVTLVDQIKGMLGHYTDSNAFDRELKEIIGKAVSLDADMWKQKAYFRILRPVIDRYDSESMELYSTEQLQDDTPNPRVTLVISPSLTKTGDSSGERYSTSTTIVKCVVSCMETDAPPRSKAMAGNFKRMIGRPSSRASNHPAVMDSTTSITKPIDTSTQPPADIVGTLTMSLSNVDGDRRHDSREPVPTRRDERGPLEPWPEPTAKDQWMPESRPPPIAKDEQNPRPNAHVHPKLPDDNIDHPHHRPSTSERTAGGPERFGTSTADPLRMSPNRNFGPRPQPPSGPVRRSSGRNRVPPDLSGRTRF
jgi:hypothetical protein